MSHVAQPITHSPVNLDEVRRAYSPKADPNEVKRNYNYDMERYLVHSSTFDLRPSTFDLLPSTYDLNHDPAALSSWLVSAFHGVEKGLTMETAKEGFGVRKIRPIMAAIRELESTGHASFATEGARGSLQSYVKFHDDLSMKIPVAFEDEIRAFVAEMDQQKFPGGSISLTRALIDAATDFDYDKFSQTRCSLRHFTDEPVSPEILENAVRQALKSPRSCNREMRRVRVVYEPEMRDQVLTYHSGNCGFGHKLGALLIITSDIREFDMVGERNQGWIDGGTFAMSLVFALHANQLGSCMMNWSVDCERDKHLRATFDIPDHEAIVTFLGVGHMPETFEVCASPSPNVDDVMSTLKYL